MRQTAISLILLGLVGCAFPVQRSATPDTSAAMAAAMPENLDKGGDLRLNPERPKSVQRMEAVYRPSSALADEPHLHLRARLRTQEHDSYNGGMGSRTVAVLE